MDVIWISEIYLHVPFPTPEGPTKTIGVISIDFSAISFERGVVSFMLDLSGVTGALAFNDNTRVGVRNGLDSDSDAYWGPLSSTADVSSTIAGMANDGLGVNWDDEDRSGVDVPTLESDRERETRELDLDGVEWEDLTTGDATTVGDPMLNDRPMTAGLSKGLSQLYTDPIPKGSFRMSP